MKWQTFSLVRLPCWKWIWRNKPVHKLLVAAATTNIPIEKRMRYFGSLRLRCLVWNQSYTYFPTFAIEQILYHIAISSSWEFGTGFFRKCELHRYNVCHVAPISAFKIIQFLLILVSYMYSKKETNREEYGMFLRFINTHILKIFTIKIVYHYYYTYYEHIHFSTLQILSAKRT